MYQLYFSQKLPISLKEAWAFFSTPANLEHITPPSLGFKIHHHLRPKMYPGQIIGYTVHPLWGFPMEWVSEITAVQELTYFIDEQRSGPYNFWHHEHWFSPISGGVLMEDLIYYKLPWGFLGRALHRLKISKDLNEIFTYRQKALEKKFGIYLENQ